MASTFCTVCDSRFFKEGAEDEIEGKSVCSYCWPYIQICECCSSLTKCKRIPKYGITACAKCRVTVSIFPNIHLIRRYMTLKRDSFTCRYCGRSPLDDSTVKLHIDHLFPKSKGGEDSLANYVTACAECNSGKKDVLLEEFERDRIKNRPQLDRDHSVAEKQWLDKVGDSQSSVS